MRKSIFAAALCLLAPLGAQALQVLDVSRAARLVDPGNGFFRFDQRSNTTGDFIATASSNGSSVLHTSQIVAGPTSIVLSNFGTNTGLPADLYASARSSTALAEVWVRMSFLTDGASMSTLASFLAKEVGRTSDLSPIAMRMSLRDLTTGDAVFDFGTVDFDPAAGWTGPLAAAHRYHFDYTVFTDALPAETVQTQLSFAITAQPVPEPATAALMLAGLALAAGAARRRRAAPAGSA